MPSYKAPVEEILFLLSDVFRFSVTIICPASPKPRPISSSHSIGSRETLRGNAASLKSAGRPHGCIRNKDGSVATPRGFKEAYRAFVAAAGSVFPPSQFWAARGCLTRSPRSSMNSRVREYGFRNVSGLSQGALAALLTHGTMRKKRFSYQN